jgi:mRNA-degrading endonuclease RelE of RelBE toxin-antitoxin system
MPVRIEPGAFAQVQRLPLTVHRRILTILERLESWPHVSGARPLRGRLSNHYRMRTGDYRLQFRVEGDTVVVERVGHRDGFYD